MKLKFEEGTIRGEFTVTVSDEALLVKPNAETFGLVSWLFSVEETDDAQVFTVKVKGEKVAEALDLDGEPSESGEEFVEWIYSTIIHADGFGGAGLLGTKAVAIAMAEAYEDGI
jgi:hypothetical protein